MLEDFPQEWVDGLVAIADTIRVIVKCIEGFRQFGLRCVLRDPEVHVGSIWWTKTRDRSRPCSLAGTRRLDTEDISVILHGIVTN